MSEARAGVDDDVIGRVSALIADLEAHPDPDVRSKVGELLEGIDAVHRAGLSHLVGGIESMAGEPFLRRLAADPAIRLLLMSYDLLAVDRHLVAEEALDAVRGHLHARGIDVELREVVGGVVYVILHGLERSGATEDAVRRDLEAALREGLLGFQELVIGDRESRASTVVTLRGPRNAHRPVYRRALDADELDPGAMRAVELDGQPILLVNVEGEVYAVANRCGDTPLPLEFGSLDDAELRCSWHGCRYDVRSGKRLDEPDAAARLAVFPVVIAGGEIRVAVAVEPVGER